MLKLHINGKLITEGTRVRVLDTDNCSADRLGRHWGSEGKVVKITPAKVSIEFVKGFCSTCNGCKTNNCEWYYNDLEHLEILQNHNRNGSNDD